MRATKLAAAFAALLLVLQLVVKAPPRELHASASWTNLAETLDEAKQLSMVILVGTVQRVTRADDIVRIARGEPGGVDRVGAEIVTIAVSTVYKGTKVPGSIPLFHTALNGATDPDPVAKPPPSGTPPSPAAPNAPAMESESRRVLLDGDPAYQVGERYLLFLRPGPRLGGVGTLALIAPEGRYLLVPPLVATNQGPTLQAFTDRGFAPTINGSPLSVVYADPKTRGRKKPKNTAAVAVGATVAAAVIYELLNHPKHAETLGAPISITPGTRDPQAPLAVRRETLGRTVAFIWQSPTQGTASGYEILISGPFGGQAATAKPYNSQTTELDIPADTFSDGTYAWTVRAIDRNGQTGPPSDRRFFTIATPPAPSSPTPTVRQPIR